MKGIYIFFYSYILFSLTGLYGHEFQNGAHSIVLDDDSELVIQRDNRATYTVRRTLKILNGEGEKYASLFVPYDEEFNKLSDISLEVIDADGNRLRNLKKKDFEDVSLSGDDVTSNRAKYAEISYHKYPYTVTHTYTLEFKGVFYLPSWHPQSSSNMMVEHATLRVKCMGPDIHFKLLGGVPDPTMDLENEMKVYQWEVNDLPLIHTEAYSPTQDLPGVLIAPDRFSIDKNDGSSRTWKDFGSFIYELNKERGELSAEIQSQILAMTDTLSEMEDKIERLYNYLQRNTRYVSIQLGIGGWQSMEARDVVEKGFGDCKALTNLMKSMLNTVGIPSYMALIKVNGKKIYTDFPSVQFDHVILCIPLPQDTMWLECTSSINPTGYLGRKTYDKSVLLITPEGGVLSSTPKMNAEENIQKRKGTITLMEDGIANVEIQTLYAGLQQERIRVVANISPRDQEEWMKDQIIPLTEDNLSFSFTETVWNAIPAYNVEYKARIMRWAKKSGTRLFLAPNTLEPFGQVPKEDPVRVQPIEISYSYLDIDSLHYFLPSDYQVEALPKMPITVESEFGKYEANIKRLQDGSFIYTRKLQIDKKRLPANQFAQFRSFWLQVAQADNVQVVLSNRS